MLNLTVEPPVPRSQGQQSSKHREECTTGRKGQPPGFKFTSWVIPKHGYEEEIVYKSLTRMLCSAINFGVIPLLIASYLLIN
jgi:hypothetical protein